MNDNGQIVWEDPPQPQTAKRTSGKWVEILDPLIGQPNRWARIATVADQTKARSHAGNLRSGIVKKPAGRWEFISRRIEGDPEQYGVYARYLGPEDGTS